MAANAYAVILLGHGSRRDHANAPLAVIAQQISDELGGVRVESGFLQLADPSLGDLVGRLVCENVDRIVVMPFFLFPGAHVTEDVPAELEELAALHPHVEFTLAPHLGTHPLLARVAAERIREAEL